VFIEQSQVGLERTRGCFNKLSGINPTATPKYMWVAAANNKAA
jgi:hypothetical protein